MKKRVDDLKRINENILNDYGEVKTFKEQLLEYKYNILPPTVPLIVLENAACLQINGLVSMPVVINQNILKKVEQKHDIKAQELMELSENLKNHVLALESRTQNNSILLVLNQKDNVERFIVVPIQFNRKVGTVDVYSIRSIYGRNNIESLIINTYQDGLKLYANRKTENWIKSIGVQFPKNLINSLSISYYTKISPECQSSPKKKPKRR